MKEKTDLDGVKFVAKQLVMVDIYITEYSPVVVQHPFTSSGIAATPSAEGLRLLDITKSKEDLRSWQSYMKGLIDNSKSAYEIYMMVERFPLVATSLLLLTAACKVRWVEISFIFLLQNCRKNDRQPFLSHL